MSPRKPVFYGSGKWVVSNPEDVWEETRRAYGSFVYDPIKRHTAQYFMNQVKELRNDGFTLAEIAEKLERHIGTIQHYNNKNRRLAD